MAKVSAGLLMYRNVQHEFEFFLAHPGGPYYKNKDSGCWTIPKGLVEFDEDFLHTAIREFEEETSICPAGNYISLGTVKYKNGKLLHAWAFEDTSNKRHQIASNTFEIEWPPKSGEMQTFPEIDRAEYFDLNTAKLKIHPVQLPLLERLLSS